MSSMVGNCRLKLTGMPQFVEIPAPVMTTTFFDFDRASAISCSCNSQVEDTFVVGISLYSRLVLTIRGVLQLTRLDISSE